MDAAHQGIASAMASTTQQIGSAVGLAVLIAVASHGTHATSGPDLVPGLRTAGYTAAALTLLGVAIALALRRSEGSRRATGDDVGLQTACPALSA
ncbi:hypothetical protein [Streptomyces sp. NPDC014006]|uniref:hypothetical protein n=1 Tax=Streptomyces sp. NPDC014006 TaxID=3364870 RepID=UPI0037035633